jgi:hypothetical protein
MAQTGRPSFVFPKFGSHRHPQPIEPVQATETNDDDDVSFNLPEQSSSSSYSPANPVQECDDDEDVAQDVIEEDNTEYFKPVPAAAVKASERRRAESKRVVAVEDVFVVEEALTPVKPSREDIEAQLVEKYNNVMSKLFQSLPNSSSSSSSSSDACDIDQPDHTPPPPTAAAGKIVKSSLASQVTVNWDLAPAVEKLPPLRQCIFDTLSATIEDKRHSWGGIMFPDFQFCEVHNRVVISALLLPEDEEEKNKTRFAKCGVCLKKAEIRLYGIDVPMFFNRTAQQADPTRMTECRDEWLETRKAARIISSNSKSTAVESKKAAVEERNVWLVYMATAYKAGLFHRVEVANVLKNGCVMTRKAIDEIDTHRDPLHRFFQDCLKRTGEGMDCEDRNYVCRQYCTTHKDYGDFVPHSIAQIYKDCGICLSHSAAAPVRKARDALSVIDMGLRASDAKKYSRKS